MIAERGSCCSLAFDVSHRLAYAALTAIGYPLESLESLCLIEPIQRRTC